jgi:hypothetical protein
MSDFGTATLDLEEKSDFRPISPRAGSKTNRVLEPAHLFSNS